MDGETCGEKKVKRPKHSCVELHQEAKEYHVSSSVKDDANPKWRNWDEDYAMGYQLHP